MGYIYTLNRISDDLSFWVCEKRGTCKARIHTRNDQACDSIGNSASSYTYALTRLCTDAKGLNKNERDNI